jgi:hypothetical protein
MAAPVEEMAIELGSAIGITVLGGVLAGVYSTFLVPPNGAVLPPDMAHLLTRSGHLAFDSA